MIRRAIIASISLAVVVSCATPEVAVRPSNNTAVTQPSPATVLSWEDMQTSSCVSKYTITDGKLVYLSQRNPGSEECQILGDQVYQEVQSGGGAAMVAGHLWVCGTQTTRQLDWQLLYGRPAPVQTQDEKEKKEKEKKDEEKKLVRLEVSFFFQKCVGRLIE